MTSVPVATEGEDLLALHQERDVSHHQRSSSAEGEPPFSHKYLYPEFAGFAGERLLKSILHKILPMALYRTWEIFADHQAPGNDCFLSIGSVAEISERVERTIRLNLHELQARKLLVLRAEHKLLRQTDGSYKQKFVVIKDFAGLYALAHEYYFWTQSEGYIEPARDFVEVIGKDECLVGKLLRFNNYRRLILNKMPGPQPQPREEHLWYTTYDAEIDGQMQTQLDASTPEPTSPDAKGARCHTTPTFGNLSLQKHLQEDLQKVSEERVITNDYTNRLERDSSDSQPPQKERRKAVLTQTSEWNQEQMCSEGGYTKNTNLLNEDGKTNSTSQSSLISEKNCTELPIKRERADLEAQAQTFVQRAMAASQTAQARTTERSQSPGANAPRIKPNALVSDFVREVSPLFCDQNIKGSLTRALRAVADTSLSRKDILACLVKAYKVTLETKKVRPQYRRPDGDVKMPLFCTMFERFAGDCATGKFHYTDERLARDIAEDDRLVLFIVEYNLEATLLNETKDQGQVLSHGGPELIEEETCVSGGDVQSLDQQEQGREPETSPLAPTPSERSIRVDNPVLGWSTYEHADWLGRRLREHLGYGTYNFLACPTQYGRWGIVLFERNRSIEEGWIFLTDDQVQEYL